MPTPTSKVPLHESLWSELYGRFDLERPATEAERVPRDDYNRVKTLSARLSLPLKERQHHLLTGPTGSGKSTELLHLVADHHERRLVMYVDLERHFVDVVRDPAALLQISAVEVLSLIGLAAVRVAKERLGIDVEPEAAELARALQRLDAPGGSAPPLQVDVPALASLLPVAMLDSTGTLTFLQVAVKSALKWTLTLGGREAPRDQEPSARSVADAVDAIFARLLRDTSQVPLIIVDGLDRVIDDGAFEHLFCRSNLLASPSFDAIYVVDLRMYGQFQRRLRFPCTALACLRVLDQADPTQPGPDLPFFHELVHRRVAGLGQRAPAGLTLVTRPQVDRLAMASGGHLRDFMRLVREVILEGWPDGEAPVEDRHVEVAIDTVRRVREAGITREELDVLSSVRDDPRRECPSGPIARDLLGSGRLLSYPNQSTWYHPHPLLMISALRDRAAPRGSNGS